jgi:hypothetical protein
LSIEPDDDAAMRTSLPVSRPVTSLNVAAYLVLPAEADVADRGASVNVRNDVTIMNTTSFTREAEVFTRRSSPRA